MNNVKKLHRAPGLVCLKMSNQVPPHLVTTDRRNLFLRLLDAVLTDVCRAKLDQLIHSNCRMSLADGDKRDLPAVAAATHGGGCDPRADARKSFCQKCFRRFTVCHNQNETQS